MQNQLKCNQNISNQYFVKGSADFHSSWLKVVEVFETHPTRNIYIGITHHPCGRFTGAYNNTTGLPSTMNFDYKYGETLENLNEEAHSLKYAKMFLISSHDSLDIIADFIYLITKKGNV